MGLREDRLVLGGMRVGMGGIGMAGCGIRSQAPVTNHLFHLLLCRDPLLPAL